MISSARHSRLATIVAGAAVAGALAPAASANHSVPPSHKKIYVNPSTGFARTTVNAPGPQSKIYVNPSTGFASGGRPSNAAANVASGSVEPQPVVEAQATAGFDWPSAAIGAAAAGGLLLLLLSALIGVGRRGRGPLANRRPLRGG